MDPITIGDLPKEVILEEILSTLDLKTALAFCTSTTANKRLCQTPEYWVARFSSLDYRTLQQDVLYWSYSGLLKELFYQVFPQLLPLLDLRTAAYVYLYALEQTHYEEAKIVKYQSLQFFGPEYGSAKERFFGASAKSYNAVLKLLHAIMGLEGTDLLNRYFSAAFLSFDETGSPDTNYFITDYIIDLLVNALDDGDLLNLYRRGKSFMMTNLSINLIRGIVRNGRGAALTNDGVVSSILLSSGMLSSSDYKQLYYDISGQNVRLMVPFRSKENVIDLLHKQRVDDVPKPFVVALVDPNELLNAYPNKSTITKHYYKTLVNTAINLGYTEWAEILTQLLAMGQDE